MPKQKRPPRNAFYFFMVDKRRELENRGYHFPGGLKDVSSAVYEDWQNINPVDKVKYEELARKAKEDDKANLHNKFTVTGESYAQVKERLHEQQEEQRSIDELIECLTRDTEVLDTRNFVLMKTINTCEVSGPTTTYWPVELAIASFNLSAGMKMNYWTLVDTGKTPTGYASAAKETQEETALPPPGSRQFRPEHKDHMKIIRNVRKFIERFVDPYNGYYGVFVMPEDVKTVEGSLIWLVQNANYENDTEARDYEKFLSKVKVCSMCVLLLKLARAAQARDPSYNAAIAMYNNLEGAAARVLNEGCFDYKDEITCSFHNQESESSKMHICCRNKVLRRVYLILKEIVPHMDISMNEGHNIENFAKKGRLPPYHSYALPKEKPEPAPRQEECGKLASNTRGTPSYSSGTTEAVSVTATAETPSPFEHLHRPVPDTLPWGSRPEARGSSLSISNADDFPSLGGNSGTSSLFGWESGVGAPAAFAGRGRGIPPVNRPEVPPPRPSSSSSWGRGVRR